VQNLKFVVQNGAKLVHNSCAICFLFWRLGGAVIKLAPPNRNPCISLGVGVQNSELVVQNGAKLVQNYVHIFTCDFHLGGANLTDPLVSLSVTANLFGTSTNVRTGICRIFVGASLPLEKVGIATS
jgi:hypothetical protein